MRAWVWVLACLSSLPAGAVPLRLAHQGVLLDSAELPLAGDHTLTFTLYDAADNELWSEAQLITFDRGYYSVVLGENTPLDEDTVGEVAELGLRIDAGDEFLPRQAVLSVPYAVHAQSATNVAGGTVDAATLSIGGVEVIDSNGNWVGLPVGTTLTEANVETYITNGALNLYTGTTLGGATISTGSHTTEAQVETFVTNGPLNLDINTTVGGAAVITATGLTWGSLLGKPAGTENTVPVFVSGSVLLGDSPIRIVKDVTSSSIVAGHGNNTITTGVIGAVVAGGGSGSLPNVVTDNYGVIGGGASNQVGDNADTGDFNDYATVGGGWDNTASGAAAAIAGGWKNTAGHYAAVGGGIENNASGYSAAIAGGYRNTASGSYSFAAGRSATASHNGSFVWGGDNNESTASTTAYQFVVRASGGAIFYSADGTGAGVQLAAGGGAWTAVSDRNAKKDIQQVEDARILEAVSKMPVYRWRYKTEVSGAEHIGPMAQDFHAAFGLGDSDRHITTVDADGVALAAIRGLYVEAREREAALTARIDALEARLAGRPNLTRAGLTGLVPWFVPAALAAAAIVRARRNRVAS